MFNGEQVNDHIEQDDHTDNIVEDDGTNTLMHTNNVVCILIIEVGKVDVSYEYQGLFVVVLHSHVGPYWECAQHGCGILGEIAN